MEKYKENTSYFTFSTFYAIFKTDLFFFLQIGCSPYLLYHIDFIICSVLTFALYFYQTFIEFHIFYL